MCRDRELLPRLPCRRSAAEPRAAPAAVRHACCVMMSSTTLAIAHVDCDAFYATIEKRDDPTLAAEPVIVGGGKRGVVATACYIARTYGVKSAMPMFEALRLVPAGQSGPAQYGEIFKGRPRSAPHDAGDLTPLVEPLSIDEAFLDLSGTGAPARHVASQSAGAFCRRRRENAAHHRIDRTVVQQIPRQSRFRYRQAARLCRAGRRRRATVPRPQARKLHLRRRQSQRRALRARRLPPHRRSAAGRARSS